MQNKSQLHFSDRILFYLSRSISSQEDINKSRWNYELTPVYGIFFLNFHLKGFEPRSIRTVQLKVDETGELFTDKLKAFTLELPDYAKKTEQECTTRIDYWLYNLVNMETMNTSIPFQKQQPIFGKVGNISELVNMTVEDRTRYSISLDTYRTNLSVMQNERAEGIAQGIEQGIAQGIEQGIAQGIEQGRAEEKLDIARNMLSLGLAPDTIVQVTGLSLKEIQELK